MTRVYRVSVPQRHHVTSRELTRTPSGLWVPGGHDGLLGDPAKRWGKLASGLALPVDPPPTLLDQIAVLADESSLGLPQSTTDDVRRILATLPFLPALVTAARLTLRLWPIRNDPDRHGDLARDVYGDAKLVPRLLALQKESGGNPRMHLFSEQQLFVLMRLILESAATDAGTDWTQQHGNTFNQALFATTSVIGEGAAKVRQQLTQLSDWLGFMTQNGRYNAYGPPIGAYVRTWRIYAELAVTPEAREHPAYCDVEAWHRDIRGVGMKELFAVGFAATQNARTDYDEPERVALAPPLAYYLASTPLAPEHEAFTAALSATREEYIEGFARSRDNPLRLAWELTPFQTKPFFRLPDDALLLLSPRAAQAFLTDGVHYRLLDAAIARGERNRFTTFVGWLFEQYVVELMEAALPGRAAGSGRVLREHTYKAGGLKTSDLALDYGADLVLCEVVSTRMPLAVRAEADEGELQTYLTRAVADKLEQVDRVIKDLQAGTAKLPGVDMPSVRRIWPVLITAGDLVEGEPLWEFVSGVCGAMLKQPGVQSVTLLGVDDVETLAGLVAHGRNLIELLHDKATGGYVALSLGRYLHDRGENPGPRLETLNARWHALTDECMATLDGGASAA